MSTRENIRLIARAPLHIHIFEILTTSTSLFILATSKARVRLI